MFRGFNLSLDTTLQKPKASLIARGEGLSDTKSALVEQALDAFVDDRGSLDASRLQEHWFPQVEADVFISHSRQDVKMAMALAGWVSETFGLEPFVDSCVWGHADDLLRRIDDQYCINPGRETYSYEKRNGSTSHIHMMLTTALGMMIDNSECLIFLNTPSSITSDEAVSKTHSPWLFMEIAMSRMIRRKSPEAHRRIIKLAENAERMREEANVRFDYTVSLDSLAAIEVQTLYRWERTFARASYEHPLDALYDIT
jgi:hypothetical protein